MCLQTATQVRFSATLDPCASRRILALRSNTLLWVRHCFAVLASAVVFLATTNSVNLARAAESPLGRATTDRQADLVDALLQNSLTSEARRICQRELGRTEPGSFPRAVWSVRLSSVRVQELRVSGDDADDLWQEARLPLEEALRGYTQQPGQPWLRLQDSLVGLAQAELRAVKMLANPADTALADRFEQGLRRTINDLRKLDEEVEQQIPLAPTLRADLANSPLAHVNDLQQLQVTTRRRITQAMLLRSEAYPVGSENAIAAATAAEDAAKRLIEALPFGSPERLSVVTMQATALRLAGQSRQAVELLEPVVRSDQADEEAMAQWLLAEMQRGNNDRVSQWFDRYYGDDPAQAPPSTAIDLARLHYLIGRLQTAQANVSNAPSAATQQQLITDWVAEIGRRDGPYAQRRAESVMLSALRGTEIGSNLTLVVAQAAQFARAGKPEDFRRAATLFQQAAELSAETPAEAFKYGLQSAACWSKANLAWQAANQFAEITARYPQQPRAAVFHLNAIRQLSSLLDVTSDSPPKAQDPTDEESAPGSEDTAASEDKAGEVRPTSAQVVDRMQALLVEHLLLWPTGPTAEPARQWTVKILVAKEQWVAAGFAELRRAPDSNQWSSALSAAFEHWLTALAATDIEHRQSLVLAMIQSLSPVAGKPVLATNSGQTPDSPDATNKLDPTSLELSKRIEIASPADRQRLAGWLNVLAVAGLNPQNLAHHWFEPETASTVTLNSLAVGVRRIRLEKIDPYAVELRFPSGAPNGQLLDLLCQRLHADGLAVESQRPLMGRAILRLQAQATEDGVPLDEAPAIEEQRELLLADALAWTGKWQQALTQYQQLAANSPTAGQALRHGARTLSTMGEAGASAAAVELWNRYASGLPVGSAAWHDAKLGTIAALVQAGKKEEASKLARYILLTKPPSDPQLKQRYEQF